MKSNSVVYPPFLRVSWVLFQYLFIGIPTPQHSNDHFHLRPFEPAFFASSFSRFCARILPTKYKRTLVFQMVSRLGFVSD